MIYLFWTIIFIIDCVLCQGPGTQQNPWNNHGNWRWNSPVMSFAVLICSIVYWYSIYSINNVCCNLYVLIFVAMKLCFVVILKIKLLCMYVCVTECR